MDLKVDTQHTIETPEAIDLTANMVGPVPRVVAYFIDLCIRGIVLGVLSIVLVYFGHAGWGLFMILSFLLEWFYPVLFEVFYNGQTPGKRRMNIAVVHDDLTPVGWSASIIRNLLRAVDILPFAYALGLVSMTCTRQFQRLGDITAGTLVVYRKKDTQWDVTLPAIQPQPAMYPLSLDDQRAITSFTIRFDDITTSRQEELANILEPVTGKKDKDAVANIQAIGVWLLGGKET